MKVLSPPAARKRERIADDLRALARRMNPGDRFPSAPELKRSYGVAAGTVEAALDTLRLAGLITRRRGSGTFVARPDAPEARPSATSTVIAALVGSSANDPLPYLRRLLGELTEFAGRTGRRVVSHHARYAGEGIDSPICDVDETLQYALDLAALRPAGYLLTFWEQAPVARELIRRGHRAVVIGVPPVAAVPDVPCVFGDHERGGYLAARHLLDLGHRRILFVHGFSHASRLTGSRRWAGHYRALREAGIGGEPAVAGNEIFDPATGAFDAWLTGPDAATGIVLWTDALMEPLWPRLQARGLRLGEDVSVVGYDDTPPSHPGLPPLDTVDQFLDRQVEFATSLLTDPAPPENPVVPVVAVAPSLVARGSCRPPHSR